MEVLVDCLVGTDTMGDGEEFWDGDSKGGSSIIGGGMWTISGVTWGDVTDADEKYSHWEVMEFQLLGYGRICSWKMTCLDKNISLECISNSVKPL